mmetsp:Transcript_12242/g.18769  ORF Transcript_12242/g.18769 Transcript_12242/m.18769 type:complete len:200 (-) Transcript_12242:890-1489(-)
MPPVDIQALDAQPAFDRVVALRRVQCFHKHALWRQLHDAVVLAHLSLQDGLVQNADTTLEAGTQQILPWTTLYLMDPWVDVDLGIRLPILWRNCRLRSHELPEHHSPVPCPTRKHPLEPVVSDAGNLLKARLAVLVLVIPLRKLQEVILILLQIPKPQHVLVVGGHQQPRTHPHHLCHSPVCVLRSGHLHLHNLIELPL